MGEENQKDKIQDIPLAEMITAVRRELDQAQEQAQGEDILFELEKVELEINVAVTQTGKGEGGIKLHVVNLGAGYERSHENVQTFKVTLKPVSTQNGEPILVAREQQEGLLPPAKK